MANLFRSLLGLSLLALSLLAHADSVRLFELHNRSADEMIPMLQPMLEPDGAVSGSGYQLIVRGTPQQMSQVESLLRQLDTAPQQLVISVRQGNSGDASGSDYSARGTFSSGDVRVGIDGPSSPRGATITGSGSNGSASLRAYSSSNQQSSNLAQRLMVLDGQWATISSGQQVPMQRRIITRTPYGSQVQQSVDYEDVSSGFDVRPRVSGAEVTLEIAPYRRHLSPEGIDTQSISSTVRGRLGEWIEIGGVDETSSGSDSGIASSSQQQRSQSSSVWLKVDVAR